MNIIDCLSNREFIDQSSSEELREVTQKPIRVYIGFDPTSDSLHLGNLMGVIALAWFQRYGHTPYVVLGGATGRIGDPSGKSKERPLLDEKVIDANIQNIKKFFRRILDFSGKYPTPVILNNEDWFSSMGFIDFLRDIGKHFRIGPMLAKESVRMRINSIEGMSFTEFSYQVLQAYDFYHLFKEEEVVLQMGGSDQWGNITAGTEFIRKMTQKSCYGLTFPLLTRSDGVKFGKTEEGAIWLNSDRLSPYEFYQYLVRVPDADVIRLMQMLTFMEMEEIAALQSAMKKSDYIPNTAQKKLAKEVTLFVHGKEGLDTALRVTQGAAPGTTTVLDGKTLREIASGMPNVILKSEDVLGKKYVDVAAKIGLMSSKSEIVRLIKNGGAYCNNERVINASFTLEKNDLIDNMFLLFSAGKKKKILITIKNVNL